MELKELWATKSGRFILLPLPTPTPPQPIDKENKKDGAFKN